METSNITHEKIENMWFTMPPVRSLGMYNKIKSTPEKIILEDETSNSNLSGSVLMPISRHHHEIGIPGVLTLNAMKIEKKVI